MNQETAQKEVPFKSPEEELQYLRLMVAEKEQALERVATPIESEQIISNEVKEYETQAPEETLDASFQISSEKAYRVAADLLPEEHDTLVEELFTHLSEKGVKNTLTVVEKMQRPHISDDFHRMLVEYIKEGGSVTGLKEGEPLWNVLHMTLYEVALPQGRREEDKQKSLKELISAMEQFYAGMLSLSDSPQELDRHLSLEIAVSNKDDHIIFYIAVPDKKKDLFEKQLQALFPGAVLTEQKNDYNIFVPDGKAVGSVASYKSNPIFPIKTYDQFDHDTLDVVLNTFSKIEKEGGGAALQLIFKPSSDKIQKKYKKALEDIQKGVSPKEALNITYTGGEEVLKTAKQFLGEFKGTKKEKKENEPIDSTIVTNVQNKVSSMVVETNIRIIASAGDEVRATEIISDIESAFNQFEDPQSNGLKFKRFTKTSAQQLFKAFSFREFINSQMLPMNLREVTSCMHLSAGGTSATPQFKEAKTSEAPAPLDLPKEGTLLGVNTFRNVESEVFMAREDRLRHMYTIGQTGTGKTTLLKSMIIQDIQQGEGVCMIDPHGTDIQDILGAIPEERYEDVIYFDPSHMEHVMALNMLEYDPKFPEQKTFVVNELLSIFKKLYGSTPESMGPAFEQYFRNATLLVLDHPESGSTLLDVSRVLADEEFRKMKLSYSQNPVVKQFWEEIAGKAGGDASLANIVPYITNKFDVFTANDFMRPLIAQQNSSFNFRNIMDERKILLVNLAKGRLGDINANLIGLILVGKILMAALSRVDSLSGDTPPFYLYIDEFQNITTDSISTILSEARKYKLSLNVAHQFIAQLEEGIRDAIFGNVGSLAVFRVGSEDAQFLEKQFDPVFMANDLMNIDNFNAYVKLLINGVPAKPFSVRINPPYESDPSKIEHLKQLSYTKYGKSREEVEKVVREKYLV